MPIRLIWLLLLGFAVACSETPVQPPAIPPDHQYPFRTAVFDSAFAWEGSVPIVTRYWVSPLGLLEERHEKGAIFHYLSTGGEAFSWQQGEKRGLQTPAGPTSLTPDTFSVLRELPAVLNPHNSRFINRERVNGYETLHYGFRWRDPQFHYYHHGEVWLLPDRAFPVRFEATELQGSYVVNNANLRFDQVLPEYFFRPPPDVKFQKINPYSGTPR